MKSPKKHRGCIRNQSDSLTQNNRGCIRIHSVGIVTTIVCIIIAIVIVILILIAILACTITVISIIIGIVAIIVTSIVVVIVTLLFRFATLAEVARDRWSYVYLFGLVSSCLARCLDFCGGAWAYV